MHPILIIALVIPIALGSWMVLRGLQTASREQRLAVIKWIVITGLFVTSAYLAWTGLWRHALGVLGSLLLFLWNWRGLLGWMAGRALRYRQTGSTRAGSTGASWTGRHAQSGPSDMKPARQPGDASFGSTNGQMGPMQQEDAMEILGLRAGYTEADVNQAWEETLRKYQDDSTSHQDSEHVNGHKDKAPKPFINAIHEARAVLLETLK